MKDKIHSTHFSGPAFAVLLVVVSALVACDANDQTGHGSKADASITNHPPSSVRFDAGLLKASGDHWWYVETPKKTDPFIWARTKVIGLDVELAAGTPLDLSFRCRPFTWPEGPVQTVEVVFNDTPVAKLDLLTKFTTYTVEIPEEVARRGMNHLELRFGHVGLPADHFDGSNDVRTLAAAFEFLTIGAKTDSVN